MSLETEKILDELIIKNYPDTKIIDKPGDSKWGQLIISKKKHNSSFTKKTLKVLLFASYKTGGIVLKTLIKIQSLYPEKLHLTGLITDDPLTSDAKISLKKRIWRKYNDREKLDIEDDIVEMAVNAGIPCFTGEIKTDFGHKLVEKLNPDAILVCVFGQIIDKPIIDLPIYGIYNFHPADLLHHHGAGPQPYQDLVDRNALTSRFTIHKLTEQLDAGDVVGQTSDINVTFPDDKLPDNVLLIEDKLFGVVDFLTVILIYNLILAKEANKKSQIDKIDFAGYFSDKQKEVLMLPITKTTTNSNIRDLTNDTNTLINKLLGNENSV